MNELPIPDHAFQDPHRKSFAQFWKRLDSYQKTGIVTIALVALTLPLGTIATMHEVRQRSQAYLPTTPPISPPFTPPPTNKPTPTPTNRPMATPQSTSLPRPSATPPLPSISPYPTPFLTPTPTSKPLPSPSPKATPAPTPQATASPTPSSTPTSITRNRKPLFLTQTLPSGTKNRSYSAVITSYDPDGDQITISVSDLPAGLTSSGCSQSRMLFVKMSQCRITGIPTRVGTFNVKATATDAKGAKITQTFILKIRS